MTLLVDIGNTRFKWARTAGGPLFEHGETVYRGETIPDTLTECWASFEPPPHVLVCNVAGSAVAEAFSAWVAKTWRAEVEYISAQAAAWGVTNAYVEPSTLGADRWATLIAAHRKFADPVCIVDCGTAITIDALAANGEHLGGLIVPGISLMRQSLSDNTEGIHEVVSGDVSLLARNTRDGVTAGTLYAAVAVIDRVVADVEAELAQGVRCIVSGGDARSVCTLLARDAFWEPDLVLQGLAVMAGAET